jgi:poly-gamma-glutamate capsule biosynthesis protein CapA/YwtB (metallophosphatase superfamily)
MRLARAGHLVFGLLASALALLSAGPGNGQTPAWPEADPQIRDPALFDERRPMEAESRLTVADGFTLALAGDLIIARPLTQATPVPGFAQLMAVIRGSDVAFGNLETSLIDIRHFQGGPYPFDGDWANIGLPAVAPDLRRMGFAVVGRANNHALDWGLEGMRETSHHLDEAGIGFAGVGETAALARAPAYLESSRGRIALVAFATTFRPTSEAMSPHGTAPARAGLSAVHLSLLVHVTQDTLKSLAAADCLMYQRSCGALPATLVLHGTTYMLDQRQFNEYRMDPQDLADLGRSIREARQHADLVIVAVHSHECEWDCDTEAKPELPGAFLKDLAHGAIDAGADVFVTTGIHNLGPIEFYHGRAVFYGLSNFFWSDIQEPVPQELYARNRVLLEQAYQHPARATDYDLTAPLNAGSFATAFTFQSVLAQVSFAHGATSLIRLYPVSLGYGENLRTSGTPRLETRPAEVRATIGQIVERTGAYGLAQLTPVPCGGGAVCVAAPAAH